MKVTYNWLKDFVNIKLTPKELAEKLTMAGLEVVSLENSGGDFVFEIEITSNRPDWLSIIGVAREISCLTGSKLKAAKPQEVKLKTKGLKSVEISVANKRDCPFYSAMIIREVKVAPSPAWLKKRLELLGCRSVNNIVDITNYILFESGQPLHAFDLDKLGQQSINVRRGRPDEKITTIDGQQRILDHEILVITDNNKPVAIAGVMGGKETEVTNKTSNILLESAVFNPILVRRSRQKLGLQSESAYRFERGVDLEVARIAPLSAQELIRALAFGRPCAYKSLGGALKSAKPVIRLEMDYISRVLGIKIPVFKIKQILVGLGFAVNTQVKSALLVKAPSFRQDIKSQIDLVEEIARIYGYEKIPLTLPVVKPRQNIPGNRDIVSNIRAILRGLGLQEAITYSLVDRSLLAKSGINKDVQPVEILNPLSEEQEVLRSTLLPSLIRTLAYNLDQQQEYISIFEIANVFYDKVDSAQHPDLSDGPVRASRASRASAQEELSLGIALCGAKSFLIKQGLIKDEVTILHLKGILESLFNKFGVKAYDFRPKEDNQINIVVGQQEVGFMLNLSEQILGSFDIKNRQVILAEVNLGKLFSHINLERTFLGIPKYPAITRDISFVIKDEVSVKELLAAIEAKGSLLLSLAKVVDYYQGKQIPDGFRGLTISCIYRASDRTLTEEEVVPLHNSICALLEERFGIKLR
ncbi:MAG: phenylalanine--tRNA ligase subunit beta [Candidatus Omnitrophica bacterium]|nr:phenylalanine--tRNA ligase subunit beta [Candidatus Omnitrophota bacterium]MBU1923997.1 phenylalanine--tRNA ligase subunit beta [Candidatus Omnitrophota bacterium]